MDYMSIGDEEIPQIGLGTYKLRGQTCRHTVREALEMGYRHIDTAEYYGNQSEIGDAIDTVAVDRDELFLTTKVWRSNLEYNAVLQSATESIEKLGVEYVDLLLIHWPSNTVPIKETIRAMNELQREGKTRHIGVSNFSVAQLENAIETSATPIFTNQVEYHPQNRQDELLEYCLKNDVLLTAYSPLAKGKLTANSTLRNIGTKYDKSAAQIALRWLTQQPMVTPIPKSATRDHLYENIDIFDFKLTDDELVKIFEERKELSPELRDRLELQ